MVYLRLIIFVLVPKSLVNVKTHVIARKIYLTLGPWDFVLRQMEMDLRCFP